MLLRDLPGHPEPQRRQPDVEPREHRHRGAGNLAERDKPGREHVAARVKNVSIAALALYLDSREVGRNSACRSVF